MRFYRNDRQWGQFSRNAIRATKLVREQWALDVKHGINFLIGMLQMNVVALTMPVPPPMQLSSIIVPQRDRIPPYPCLSHSSINKVHNRTALGETTPPPPPLLFSAPFHIITDTSVYHLMLID